MAKPPIKQLPRKAMLPPDLREFVLSQDSKKELMAILNSHVFIAACAYVAQQSDPLALIDSATPDNLLNRLHAFHSGQSCFYEALAKIVSTKKTDPQPPAKPAWGDASLNPTA